MNITIISGSPRINSFSNRVALNLEKELQENTPHQVNLVDVRNHDISLLQQVWTSVDKAPQHLQPLAQTIFDTDAFILVSPEFNGSYTPAMKNLLDHFPKQHHKAFGIVTASPGAFGGMRATQQMQLLVAALFGILAPHMLVVPAVDKKFAVDGSLIDPGFQTAIDTFLNEFLWLAERTQPVAEPAYN